MYTVVRGVLVAPLPYRDPGSLVTIWSRWTNFDKTWVSDQEVLDYQARNRTMSGIAAWDVTRVTLTGAGDAVRVGAALTTANAFDVFGVRPVLGRTYTEDEARGSGPDQPVLIVLSYGLWQRQFGGDAGAIERHLDLNGRPAQDRRRDAARLPAPDRFRRRRGRAIGAVGADVLRSEADRARQPRLLRRGPAQAGRDRPRRRPTTWRRSRRRSRPKVSTRRRLTSRRSPCRSTTRSSAASGGRSTSCWGPSAS